MIELKYSRAEIYDAMYAIAQSEGHGLLEHEKLVVTKEIEDWTRQDITMDINLRAQAQAFNIFRSFKREYGDGNREWVEEVHNLFGKVKKSWLREMVEELVGEGTLSRKELAKQIAIKRDMSVRTAYRKINEFLEVDEIHTNKINGGDISVKPFKWLIWGR